MSNALASADSLYLRQHGDNPVQWREWTTDVLAEAREADRPILLSIGYSACHWCHVMAHECFENEDIAALMNEHFVNIKLDREERPDLDKVYQLCHQLMNQSGGGWPLTVFLDPKTLAPFFTGTYFPPQPRHGLPAFPTVLTALARAFREQRADISSQREQLAAAFRQLAPAGAAIPPAELIDAGVRELVGNYDEAHGGWSGAPKFPHPLTCEFLLRHGGGVGRSQALHTLEAMTRGGLFDQLGGGYFRYSVDARWAIPHFEKMLYDNGQMLSACAAALRGSPGPLHERSTAATVNWMEREMRAEGPLYCATLDADSEGEEGRYYVWDRAELDSAAGDLAPQLTELFRLDGEPNFEGRWHLQASIRGEVPAAQADALRQRLFEHREQRVRPTRDDKQLTAWNALAARGLVLAGDAMDRQAWIDRAIEVLDGIHEQCWDGETLLALTRPATPGFLDDYAYTLDALLCLLRRRWDSRQLNWAIALADQMLARFGDGGALHFSAAGEDLIHRPQPLMDDATPAGNGIAARVLLQLGDLVAEPRYLEAAEGILRAAGPAMRRHPSAHVSLLLALAEYHGAAPLAIVIEASGKAGEWREAAREGAQLYLIPPDTGDLPEALSGKLETGAGRAYVCHRGQCSAPLGTPIELRRALSAAASAATDR